MPRPPLPEIRLPATVFLTAVPATRMPVVVLPETTFAFARAAS